MLHLEGTTLNLNEVNSVSKRTGNTEFAFNIKSLQFDLITLASGFRRDVTAALSWDFTQRSVVVKYRRFGTTYRFYVSRVKLSKKSS